MVFTPIPANTHTICCYAAFLARSLQFSSINNYLGIIALLHKEFGLPNPLVDNWVLKSLLSGIKRVKGSTVKQKLPITLDILLGIRRIINLNISYDASFWAVCLTAFLAFLGNLTCCLYLTYNMTPINSFLGLVFNFLTREHLFRSHGAKPFSLERDQFTFLSLIFPIHCLPCLQCFTCYVFYQDVLTHVPCFRLF